MDNLEVAACVNDHSCNLTYINGTGIGAILFHNGVTNLEKFLWHILASVTIEALKETRQERGSHNFKLKSLGVLELDALLSVNWLAHILVVVIDGNEGES